ncbi:MULTISPECIES: hypothetical protein [unclassified Microcella]|uniref:hypothetical protein n=1 Tax=unclassified Microcella TaxID=2630066 RepID=UPI0006FF1FEF|nr:MULTISPECIES: hypothetical protein [unclassified Microcella]KQV25229.1 hypothetical protein ASC54_12370 [Yonghaparkia sp. Root332]KRF31517.1 hypothetical protein ASG83_12205 [Yonghaparkia sp. Soil809]
MTEPASSSHPQSEPRSARRRPQLRYLITGIVLLVAGVVFITLLDSTPMGIGLLIIGLVLAGLSFTSSGSGPGGGTRPSHSESGYPGGYGGGSLWGGGGTTAGRDG